MTPEIEELIQQIEQAGKKFEWFGPQSVESVRDLETALGVNLPPSFQSFLVRYGGGGVRAWAGISGIWKGSAKTPNQGTAFGDTVRLRNERGLPTSMVVIYAIYGSEEHFPPTCLDTAHAGADGECPVVRYEVLSKKISRPEHNTFSEFLTFHLRSILDVI